jgi:hypothetical protein
LQRNGAIEPKPCPQEGRAEKKILFLEEGLLFHEFLVGEMIFSRDPAGWELMKAQKRSAISRPMPLDVYRFLEVVHQMTGNLSC